MKVQSKLHQIPLLTKQTYTTFKKKKNQTFFITHMDAGRNEANRKKKKEKKRILERLLQLISTKQEP